MFGFQEKRNLVVSEFFKTKGVFQQNLGWFNYFLNFEMKKIVQANEKIVSSSNPTFYLKYLDIHVGKPDSVVYMEEV